MKQCLLIISTTTCSLIRMNRPWTKLQQLDYSRYPGKGRNASGSIIWSCASTVSVYTQIVLMTLLTTAIQLLLLRMSFHPLLLRLHNNHHRWTSHSLDHRKTAAPVTTQESPPQRRLPGVILSGMRCRVFMCHVKLHSLINKTKVLNLSTGKVCMQVHNDNFCSTNTSSSTTGDYSVCSSVIFPLIQSANNLHV